MCASHQQVGGVRPLKRPILSFIINTLHLTWPRLAQFAESRLGEGKSGRGRQPVACSMSARKLSSVPSRSNQERVIGGLQLRASGKNFLRGREMRLEAETELKERLRIAGCFCKQGGLKLDDRGGSNVG